jgi:Uma2 family endonuclease
VEILSPFNRAVEMRQKVLEYLATGSRLVWVIDPDARTAVAHRSPTESQVVDLREALDGDSVLPGFNLPLARLFDF